jgi:hypothetical protein
VSKQSWGNMQCKLYIGSEKLPGFTIAINLYFFTSRAPLLSSISSLLSSCLRPQIHLSHFGRDTSWGRRFIKVGFIHVHQQKCQALSIYFTGHNNFRSVLDTFQTFQTCLPRTAFSVSQCVDETDCHHCFMEAYLKIKKSTI